VTRGRAALLGLTVALLLVGATPVGAASTPRAAYAAACRRAATVTADRRSTPAVVPVSVCRALAPTPLPIVLPDARAAVVARVVAVLYQGRRLPTPHHPAGFAGPIPPARCQVVRLQVVRALLGTPPSRIVVVKPVAPYLLAPSRGVQPGTFLLDDSTPYPDILGNYGPNYYAPSDVTAALAAAGRTSS
jgi:hypothetical protein